MKNKNKLKNTIRVVHRVALGSLALMPIVDVFTDAEATIQYFKANHVWWGWISITVMYLSFRFGLLFFIFKPTPTWKAIIGFLVPGFVPDFLNGEVKLVQSLLFDAEEYRSVGVVTIPHIIPQNEKKEDQNHDIIVKIKGRVPSFLKFLKSARIFIGFALFELNDSNRPAFIRTTARIVTEVILLVLSPVLGPLVLVNSCVALSVMHMRALSMPSKEKHSPVEVKRAMELRVTTFAEATFESTPQIVLQTRVYLYGGLKLQLYALSAICSGVSVLKAALDFIFHRRQMLQILKTSTQAAATKRFQMAMRAAMVEEEDRCAMYDQEYEIARKQVWMIAMKIPE